MWCGKRDGGWASIYYVSKRMIHYLERTKNVDKVLWKKGSPWVEYTGCGLGSMVQGEVGHIVVHEWSIMGVD